MDDQVVIEVAIDPRKCNKCREEFQPEIHKPQTFPCGHRYCSPCYYSFSGNPACPICKDFDAEKLQNWERHGAKVGGYLFKFLRSTAQGAYRLYTYTASGVAYSYRYITGRLRTYEEVV